MTTTLKISICQMNPDVGDIEKNTDFIISEAQKAHKRGSDLIIFPEMATTGYYPGDLLNRQDFVSRAYDANRRILNASGETGEMTWMFGTIGATEGRTKLLNRLFVIKGGRLVNSKSKELLPTYGVFDEFRHFDPGPAADVVVKVKCLRIGLLVCEDAWTDDKLYSTAPLLRLCNVCPDLIVSVNASPSNLGKMEKRLSIFKGVCLANDLAAIYVNQVGGQDQIVYDGGSFFTDGTYTMSMPQFIAMTRDFLYKDGHFHPLPSDDLRSGDAGILDDIPLGDDKYPLYYKQILLGLRDYARRCGFKSALVGSSGGIDSAITIALAVEALGPENVLAITMPSQYSSPGSVDDSRILCDNLGVKFLYHPIRDIFDINMQMFHKVRGGELTGLAAENIQARIRGTILMGYSNQLGHLLLTTGNKSEMAVGYCTLYGDTNGGLGLIGDLYKTEVFGLAKFYNRLKADKNLPGIPDSIINKAPSAELAPGQKDSDSLPPYDVLDLILRNELEGELVDGILSAVMKEGTETVLKVRRMIARSEYKRKQAPPIIRLRPVAFGAGRQIPITAKQF